MSQPSVQIIYIPGLGDNYDMLRRSALKYWKSKNVRTEIVSMRWRDPDETIEQKQQRVRHAIDSAHAKHIVLVGESAGGSMAVAETLRAGSRVDRCITICGKNVRADRVSPRLYAHNPAFRSSMAAADAAIADMDPATDGKNFTLFYSPYDPVIWPVDTRIPGAKLRKIPMFGHLLSIAFVLFIYKQTIIKEATR